VGRRLERYENRQVIIVDSSVWIDYFRGERNAQTDKLDALVMTEAVTVGDLILAEVLQGFSSEIDFREARKEMMRFELIELGGCELAVKAATNYRSLKKRGFTIRKTVDSIIATRCIEDGYILLHNDRDFDPFEKYLGLKVLH
jgi:predicted nucleic acid-binding protein